MKQIEFLITEIEGDIVAYSNAVHFAVYCTEINKYFEKQRELNKLAFPQTNVTENSNIFDSIFLDQEPLFNVNKKMIEQGYLYQSLYSYKPEDGKNGHGIYETPFAKIETFLLDQRISFNASDGVCVANKKVVITLKT